LRLFLVNSEFLNPLTSRLTLRPFQKKRSLKQEGGKKFNHAFVLSSAFFPSTLLGCFRAGFMCYYLNLKVLIPRLDCLLISPKTLDFQLIGNCPHVYGVLADVCYTFLIITTLITLGLQASLNSARSRLALVWQQKTNLMTA